MKVIQDRFRSRIHFRLEPEPPDRHWTRDHRRERERHLADVQPDSDQLIEVIFDDVKLLLVSYFPKRMSKMKFLVKNNQFSRKYPVFSKNIQFYPNNIQFNPKNIQFYPKNIRFYPINIQFSQKHLVSPQEYPVLPRKYPVFRQKSMVSLCFQNLFLRFKIKNSEQFWKKAKTLIVE